MERKTKYSSAEREILSHVSGWEYKYLSQIILDKTSKEALSVMIRDLDLKVKSLTKEWDENKATFTGEEYTQKYTKFLNDTRSLRTLIKYLKKYREIQKDRARIRKMECEIEATLADVDEIKDYVEDESLVTEEEFFKPD